MVDKIIELDKEFFLMLNSKHISWLDPIMLVLSSYTMWAIVFIIFGMLIYFYQEKHKISSVVFYTLSVLLSTTLTNGLKLIVQRPRPIHETSWEGIIHNIESFSTSFSFFSSHAATTFCIATFSSFVLKNNKYLGYVAYVWAMGVSYSRIYVSKHYPLDVTIGIIFGILIGYLGYICSEKYAKIK